MRPFLEIENLHVAYGKVEAVRGVNLVLQAGQIVTVIGPNGAGKTTLLAAIAGLLRCRPIGKFPAAPPGAKSRPTRLS